ncbi:Lrp/AsnC family transcriptional regulator [Candidatus Sumerlaeota bacterium]|nr:Lrp/AsnC family transcriptional regulator [Candidatus Sumerlaeota bacterium]
MRQAVLDILRNHARTPVSEIARRLDRSEEEIQRTIDELEKSKTVLGYQAVVNPEKLDEEPCLGIIEVKIKPERQRGYDAIAEQIYRFPEVKLCYLVSGDYDVLVFVEGSSLKSVSHFVTEKLATIDNVAGTTTHFILKKFKEFGVAMGGDERTERLVVSP